MSSRFQAHSRAPFARLSPAALALLFGIATYAILSLRAELAPEVNAGLIQLRRVVGTAGGAILFWLILRHFENGPSAVKLGAGRLSATLIAAGLGLLAIRVAYGWANEAEAVSLAQNVRWTILWVGYLKVGVALYLAHLLRRSTPASAVAACDTLSTSSQSSIEWLADVMVEELCASGVTDRQQLISHLRARAGYFVADPLAADENRRIELLESLMARLSRDQTARLRDWP